MCRNELRREFFAIALRAVANRAQFLESGINSGNAAFEFRTRISVAALDTPGVELQQWQIAHFGLPLRKITVSGVDDRQREPSPGSRPARQWRKILRAISLDFGHDTVSFAGTGRVPSTRPP